MKELMMMSAKGKCVLMVFLLVTCAFAALMNATGAQRDHSVPAWGGGSYWTYATDTEVQFNLSFNGTSINITHISGTVTDTIGESTSFGGFSVYLLEGSYSETIRGNVTYLGFTLPVMWTARGNTTEYYRISDLASVYTMQHFVIDMGLLGTMTVDTTTLASPPVLNYGFPLSVPDAWLVDSSLTTTTKTSGAMGSSNSTNTTRIIYAAAVLAQETITVPAGQFQCYNISEAGSTAQDGGPAIPFNGSRLYCGALAHEVTRQLGFIGNSSIVFQLSDYYLNWPPVASSPLPAPVFPEDTVYTALNLKTVFSDPDAGDRLVFYAFNCTNITVHIDNATGAVTLFPRTDWSGSETVLFRAVDNHGGAADAKLSLTVTPVNDRPALVQAIPDLSMDEDALNGSLRLSEYFADADAPYGDRLNFSFSGNGHIAVSISPEGTVTLIPPKDWSGSQNISFAATDNASTEANDTLQLTVMPFPDAPQAICASHELATPEDTTLVLVLVDRFTDADVPYGDALGFTVSGLPLNFSQKISQTGIAELTPANDFAGTVSGLITATDSTMRTATENFTLTVTPVNDAPVLHDAENGGDAVSLMENSSRTFNVNATDIDSPLLIVSWMLDDAAVGYGPAFKYSPGFSEAGNYTLTALVSDGALNVTRNWTVTVIDQNRKPSGVSISSPANGTKFPEGNAVLLSASATDPDGDNLTITWKDTSGKVIGTGMSVQTRNLTRGRHCITVEISDGKDTVSARTTISISPRPVNGGPGFEAVTLVCGMLAAIALTRKKK